jgi:hypothetical protein
VTDTAEAITAVLRSGHGQDLRELLDRLSEALPGQTPPDDHAIDILSGALRGGLGDEHDHIDEDPAAHLAFWKALSERFPQVPRLRGIYADTLLLTGRPDEALTEFLAAFAVDPRVLYAFGGELRDLFESRGGLPWALYRATAVRAAELDDPEGNRDYVQDVTKELADEFRHDPRTLQAIFAVLRSGREPHPGP